MQPAADRGAFDLLLRRRPLLALVAVWLIGLSSVGGVLFLQHRLDQRRQALVVVADLRKEASDLSPIAFQTTLGVPEPVVRARLALGEAQLTASATSLTRLSGNDADSKRILAQARPLFALLASANELVSSGHLRRAGLLMLGGVAPGGAIASLRSTFDETATKYDREAASAKKLADLGTLLTIVLVLFAFSLALRRATRLAAEKHRLLEKSLEDALTDSLTGLGNRRKLFRDIDVLLAEQRSGEKLALGMFDLDGFKAYNDALGHPAGDALLARLGQRLSAAIGGDGRAYRIGGDEFCVIARGDGADALLELAQEALSEHDLYLEALDRYLRTRDPSPVEVLSQPGPALPAVRWLVERHAEEAACDERRRGCMVVNAAVERLPFDRKVARRVEGAWDEIEIALTSALDPGAGPGGTQPRQGSARPRPLPPRRDPGAPRRRQGARRSGPPPRCGARGAHRPGLTPTTVP